MSISVPSVFIGWNSLTLPVGTSVGRINKPIEPCSIDGVHESNATNGVNECNEFSGPTTLLKGCSDKEYRTFHTRHAISML